VQRGHGIRIEQHAHLERTDPAIPETALGLQEGDRLSVLQVDDRRALDIVERPAKPDEDVVIERCVRCVVTTPVQHVFGQQSQVCRSGPDAEERVFHPQDTRGETAAVSASHHRLELP
jgi:hypothetical protein